jgi:hypothetical protein
VICRLLPEVLRIAGYIRSTLDSLLVDLHPLSPTASPVGTLTIAILKTQNHEVRSLASRSHAVDLVQARDASVVSRRSATLAFAGSR